MSVILIWAKIINVTLLLEYWLNTVKNFEPSNLYITSEHTCDAAAIAALLCCWELMMVTLVFALLDVTTVAGKVCEVTVWAPDWWEIATDWFVGCVDEAEVSTGWLRAMLPELLSTRDGIIWGCDEVRLCILLPDWLRLMPVILLLFAGNKN